MPRGSGRVVWWPARPVVEPSATTPATSPTPATRAPPPPPSLAAGLFRNPSLTFVWSDWTSMLSHWRPLRAGPTLTGPAPRTTSRGWTPSLGQPQVSPGWSRADLTNCLHLQAALGRLCPRSVGSTPANTSTLTPELKHPTTPSSMPSWLAARPGPGRCWWPRSPATQGLFLLQGVCNTIQELRDSWDPSTSWPAVTSTSMTSTTRSASGERPDIAGLATLRAPTRTPSNSPGPRPTTKGSFN